MEPPVILVSAAGGDIGFSILQAMGDMAALVLGCDVNPCPFLADRVENFFCVPPAVETRAYFEAVKRLIGEHKVDYFLPVSEPEIRTVNRMRAQFESLGTQLVINNSLIISNFLDKLKTAQYLSSLEIKTPRTTLMQHYAGEYELPVIIKSRFGSGSRKNWLVRHRDELDWLRKFDDGTLIVQEHVGSLDHEYTSAIFSDSREVSVISFKRKLGFGGLSVEAELVEEPKLTRVARRIALQTKLKGSLNLQSRRVDEDFIPFEINPRISSTLSIRRTFGFNDAVWWVEMLGGKFHSYTPKFRKGFARRVVRDIYYGLEPA